MGDLGCRSELEASMLEVIVASLPSLALFLLLATALRRATGSGSPRLPERPLLKLDSGTPYRTAGQIRGRDWPAPPKPPAEEIFKAEWEVLADKLPSLYKILDRHCVELVKALHIEPVAARTFENKTLAERVATELRRHPRLKVEIVGVSGTRVRIRRAV